MVLATRFMPPRERERPNKYQVTMTEREMKSPRDLRGLSATGIGSFRARVQYYRDARFRLAELYRNSDQFFRIEETYQTMFPDCNDTLQMGGYASAREKVLQEKAMTALEDGTVTNLVILACGLSPLTAHMRELLNETTSGRNVQIICTDLAEPLFLQRSLCRHLLKDHHTEGVEFHPLNVLRKEDWEGLESLLLPGGVAIICEGLLGYFRRSQIQQTLNHAARLTTKRGGFTVTDVVSKKGWRESLYEGDSKALLHRFYAVANFDPRRIAFEDGRDCSTFLTRQHLKGGWVGLKDPTKMYVPSAAGEADRAILAKIFNRQMCIQVTR